MYQLLAAGSGRKWERLGPWIIERPSPAAVWDLGGAAGVALPEPHAIYQRAVGSSAEEGPGTWTFRHSLPERWEVEYGGLKFWAKTTLHGHWGVFPEQYDNWLRIRDSVTQWQSQQALSSAAASPQSFRLLNLFAYTGGASFAAALSGAEVTHVDASKGTISWARQNADLNSTKDLKLRWICEDVVLFCQRALKRGLTYHGIVLDPPTYGRGPAGQVWQIDKNLSELLKVLKLLLADDWCFVSLSSHSPGYSPMALRQLLASLIADQAKSDDCDILAEEMSIPIEAKYNTKKPQHLMENDFEPKYPQFKSKPIAKMSPWVLPAGATAWLTRRS